MSDLSLVCESPIERLLFDELSKRCTFARDSVGDIVGRGDGFVVYPQFNVPPYRLDFAVVATDGGDRPRKVDVEVDGHEFHERTKEQAAHDKARDRLLQSRDWKVLRFTGSEVFQDAALCVHEALTAVLGKPIRRPWE